MVSIDLTAPKAAMLYVVGSDGSVRSQTVYPGGATVRVGGREVVVPVGQTRCVVSDGPVERTPGAAVSALVASALADRLGATGTCRIAMYEYPSTTPLRYEVFEGRWLTDTPPIDADGIRVTEGSWERRQDGREWDTYVAETARGRVAVYVLHYNTDYNKPPLFQVFEDLDTAQRALAGDERVDQDEIRRASSALGRNGKRGEEVRWLDI